MTAATLIIDASALVKILVREPDSDIYMAAIQEGHRLGAPAHILAETGEVLSRKMRAGHVDTAQLRLIANQLDAELDVIPVLGLFEQAISIALAVGASVYDCLYVAAADRYRRQLLTADARLIARLAGTVYQPLLLPLDSARGPQ